MEVLSERTSPGQASQLDRFCRNLESTAEGVEIVCNKKFITKCHYSEGDREKSHWLFTVTKTGKVALGGQKQWKLGSEEVRNVIELFWSRVAKLIPELQPQLLDSGSMSRPSCPLQKLLQHREQLEPFMVEHANNLNSLE